MEVLYRYLASLKFPSVITFTLVARSGDGASFARLGYSSMDVDLIDESGRRGGAHTLNAAWRPSPSAEYKHPKRSAYPTLLRLISHSG